MLGFPNVPALCIELEALVTLIIPAGYGSATCSMNLSGKAEPLSFTFGFINPENLTAPVAAANIRAALTATDSLWRAGEVLTSYTFGQVDVTINTLSGTFVGSSSGTTTGTLSGDPMPPNCALLVAKNTARGGRQGRGRMFLPPAFYGESGFDATGNFIGAGQARIQDDLDTLLDALTAQDVSMVLLHTEAETPPDPVTSLVLSSRIATQRRRLR